MYNESNIKTGKENLKKKAWSVKPTGAPVTTTIIIKGQKELSLRRYDHSPPSLNEDRANQMSHSTLPIFVIEQYETLSPIIGAMRSMVLNALT